MKQIHPAVPAVYRIYADVECTKGGLAMSRSLGDTNIHKYGVISTPSTNQISLSHYQGDVLLLLGSDGLMAYLPKQDCLTQLMINNKKESLAYRLNVACEVAKQFTLESTNNVYSDDTSGIALSWHL